MKGRILVLRQMRNGQFIIINIPPGVYNVRISFIGYETVIFQDVNIIVDQTTEISASLNPQSVEVTDIIVSAESPMIRK
ncbi:MAG: carboxypeptidase-like regulatory domain-containing protein [Melioribacteraceae bacterium]|nr:carboxypeptidase-like regulatory domain-containing protein [Melioribacteraceae bacterium]